MNTCLHSLVRTIKRDSTVGEADQETLGEISWILTEHLRFEEKELFPVVERLIPEEQLQDLATVGRRDV